MQIADTQSLMLVKTILTKLQFTVSFPYLDGVEDDDDDGDDDDNDDDDDDDISTPGFDT